MNKFELKQNFENQLKEIDEKITQIQSELTKAQEYKIKLQGGLETIDLLLKEEPIQDNIPKDTSDVKTGEMPPREDIEKEIEKLEKI